jgi:hypothetical protein
MVTEYNKPRYTKGVISTTQTFKADQDKKAEVKKEETKDA